MLYTCQCYFHCLNLSHILLPPTSSTHLFSTSMSLFLSCKNVHHFSRFHIHALMYDICFSLSDWLHSVWQTRGPSTSLQMTQFHSLLWLSNIHYMYVPHHLYSFICWWTFRSLHVLAILNSGDMNIEVHEKNLKLSFMLNVYKVKDCGTEEKIIFSKISDLWGGTLPIIKNWYI